MIKTSQIFFLSLLLSLFLTCKTSGQGDKYISMARALVKAFKENDTEKIYSIVDTTNYFKVKSKETLINVGNFINTQLSLNKCKFNDRSIQILNNEDYIKQYIFKFCRDENGQMLPASFDVVIEFLVFQDSKVSDVKIVDYNLQGKPAPKY